VRKIERERERERDHGRESWRCVCVRVRQSKIRERRLNEDGLLFFVVAEVCIFLEREMSDAPRPHRAM
jgi:hypothetical protein